MDFKKFSALFLVALLLTSPVFASSGTGYVKGSLVLEGTTNDDYEATITTEPTADRAITLPNAAGTIPLFQASFSATKLYVATDTVASGATSKAVTVTGITTAAKCFVTANEVPTNAVYVKNVVPTSNTATVTVSGDPGASNLDLNVLCVE